MPNVSQRPRRLARPLARLLALLAVAVAAVAGAVLAPAASADAATPAPFAQFQNAVQHRDGSVWITGWTYDRADPRPNLPVCVNANGRCVARLLSVRPDAGFDRAHHITGNHRFAVTLRRLPAGVRLTLSPVTAPRHVLAARFVSTAGSRVAAIARQFVGRVRYVDGGASPRAGFDCSGLTQWAYSHAGVAWLPHNAQAQRFAPFMHRISRAQARPGDLVFYLSGGYAYHVAVYAGHGWQYAAATPRDGIRYQPIWSPYVEFRTDWH